VFRRPDGRTFTRDPADVDDAGDVYASVDGDLEPWLAAGFVEHRRENHYVVWTNARAEPPPTPPGISFVTVDRVDLDRLRALDDLLRQDVPGTDGWRWEPIAFVEETAAADSKLYVVAVDDANGEYVGIARVWGDRLGFVGVARDYRRRGIARALLGRIFAVLAARGITEVTTEIDVQNVASRRTIEPLGSRVVGQSVELVRRIR
jgi:ribosomal protein S18 acetylase RimI-like enzyme